MGIYRLLAQLILLLSFSLPVISGNDIFTLENAQGGWWGSCEDEAVAFYIDGDTYSGDFLGTYHVELSNNILLFKSGLPEGHSIHVDGNPMSYLVLNLNQKVLTLKHQGDYEEFGEFVLYSCN